MKAVCTTFGCWVAAAAPTALAVPFVADSKSPLGIACEFIGLPRSVTGLLNVGGGPIVAAEVDEGVMSIGSGAAACGLGELLAEEEGNMGIALRLEAKGSVKGERDISVVAAAMSKVGVDCAAR
jgi:hypothetical protein